MQLVKIAIKVKSLHRKVTDQLDLQVSKIAERRPRIHQKTRRFRANLPSESTSAHAHRVRYKPMVSGFCTSLVHTSTDRTIGSQTPRPYLLAGKESAHVT
jgi:hypothetical protein